MKREIRNTFLFFISFSIAFLFGLMIMNDSKSVVKTDDDTEKSPRDNYEVYEIDQLVSLSDNSLWYVLSKDSSSSRDVTLISKDKINDTVITSPLEYIEDTYLDKLCNNLTISRNTISMRLLNSYDIISLYDSDDISTFDRSKYRLLDNNTIVSDLEGDYFNSLCDNSICLSKNTDIRVVLVIPKYFIKES